MQQCNWCKVATLLRSQGPPLPPPQPPQNSADASSEPTLLQASPQQSSHGKPAEASSTCALLCRAALLEGPATGQLAHRVAEAGPVAAGPVCRAPLRAQHQVGRGAEVRHRIYEHLHTHTVHSRHDRRQASECRWGTEFSGKVAFRLHVRRRDRRARLVIAQSAQLGVQPLPVTTPQDALTRNMRPDVLVVSICTHLAMLANKGVRAAAAGLQLADGAGAQRCNGAERVVGRQVRRRHARAVRKLLQ